MHLSGDDIGHQENVYRAASRRKEHVTDDGARQRLILDMIPQIVWIAGADGSTHYLNRSGADRLGVPAEAIYGWHWLDWLHPDDVNRARDRWEVSHTRDGRLPERVPATPGGWDVPMVSRASRRTA